MLFWVSARVLPFSECFHPWRHLGPQHLEVDRLVVARNRVHFLRANPSKVQVGGKPHVRHCLATGSPFPSPQSRAMAWLHNGSEPLAMWLLASI